jgi:hypothetical protein
MELTLDFENGNDSEFAKNVTRELNEMAESCGLIKVGQDQDDAWLLVRGIIPTSFIRIVSKAFDDEPIFYNYIDSNGNRVEHGAYQGGTLYMEVGGEWQKC